MESQSAFGSVWTPARSHATLSLATAQLTILSFDRTFVWGVQCQSTVRTIYRLALHGGGRLCKAGRAEADLSSA